VILADRDGEQARAEAGHITAMGGRAEAVTLDVRDAAAVSALVGDAFLRHGRLDYLFNNAGIGIAAEARDLTLDDWRDAVEVNLMGPIHGVHAAWPRLVAQGFGHIVNTASMAAFIATPLTAPYGTTKSAVVALSRALRVEGAALGVRVSALCPGVVRTPILDNAGRHGRVRLRPPLPGATLLAMAERVRPMDVDLFARKTLIDVARNRAVIVHPSWWRALRLLSAIAPSLVDAFSSRELAKLRALQER
jgi:NAD(P)-dependent dehydrogenase (short-subunit alcohol dehydrogenase family)